MASGGGHYFTKYNSAPDEDTRWAFPNNLDSCKHPPRPKKQGNKGGQREGSHTPLSDKLNISLSELESPNKASGQTLDKKDNLRKMQSGHTLLFNHINDTLHNIERSEEPVNSQEFVKLEMLLSMLQKEQQQLSENEPQSPRLPPKAKEEDILSEKAVKKSPHNKEKMKVLLQHQQMLEQLQTATNTKLEQARMLHKQLYEKLEPTELEWKSLDPSSQNSIEGLHQQLVMLADDKEKNRVLSSLHQDVPEFNGIGKNTLVGQVTQNIESQRQQLEELKAQINHLKKKITNTDPEEALKNSHWDELQGKSVRNNNLNQFPARRHYEAEGRANEDPDLALNLADSDEDDDLWENDIQIQDKLKKLQETKKQLRTVCNLISLSNPATQLPQALTETKILDNNYISMEAMAEKMKSKERKLERLLTERRNLETLKKQLLKMKTQQEVAPRFDLPYDKDSSQKDTNVSSKLKTGPNNYSQSISSEEGNSSLLPLGTSWGRGFSVEDEDEDIENASRFGETPNNCRAGVRGPPEPTRKPNNQPTAPNPRPENPPPSEPWLWHIQTQLDQMTSLFQTLVSDQQNRFMAQPLPFDAVRPNLSHLLLSLSQCYHMLYLQQQEIHHLHRCINQEGERPPNPELWAWSTPGTQPTANETLNNQLPPRMRPTNNFWDNFRSYSCQNLLSSASSVKTAEPGEGTTGSTGGNDRTTSNSDVQQQTMSKKPNTTFNRLNSGPAVKPKQSESEPSNISYNSAGSPPFASVFMEFSKLLSSRDTSYLVELLKQVQCLDSDELRVKALHSLQELASSHHEEKMRRETSQVKESPQTPSTSSTSTVPEDLQGPESSTGAVRKSTRPKISTSKVASTWCPDLSPPNPPLPLLPTEGLPLPLKDVDSEFAKVEKTQTPRTPQHEDPEDLAEADQTGDDTLLGAVGGLDEKKVEASGPIVPCIPSAPEVDEDSTASKVEETEEASLTFKDKENADNLDQP